MRIGRGRAHCRRHPRPRPRRRGTSAPNARLRQAVIETAGPSGATLQILQQAQQKMNLQDGPPEVDGRTHIHKTAARCWALLLARIYECLPLRCPRCSQPMRIIAFIVEPAVIERILTHVGEPTEPPAVLPARAPPQLELGFDQDPERLVPPGKPGRTWIKQVVSRTRSGTDPRNNKMLVGIPETLASTGKETGWCRRVPGIPRQRANWALVRVLGSFLVEVKIEGGPGM